MQPRWPVIVWGVLFTMWFFAFVMLISLAHSKAGMGDALVENCLRQKALAELALEGRISAR